MKVIGIMLVRDEDRFVEWAIRSAIDFCDEFLVCDHGSRDRTPEILGRLVAEYTPKLKVRRCTRSGESHEIIAGYAGSPTWIFGVDGDEIYDREGLRNMRRRLEAGEFDKWWVVFGNVLNVTELEPAVARVRGYLAPPCRSMTKLYNFGAIDAWDGKIVERLHGGEIHFRPGFDESLRLNLHEFAPWDRTDFRCLHLCFLDRSSIDEPGGAPRRNIMDRHAWSVGKLLSRVRAALAGKPAEDWKKQKYARGPLVEESIEQFLEAHPDRRR